ncbi:MAG: CFI-box-CTERM domain-containing protein [Bacteriovorax sp.]
MKFLMTFIFFCLTLNLFAADTVRINDAANLVVTGSTAPANVSFTLTSDPPSGDATSDTAPARVYLPIQSGVAKPAAPFDQIDYSILKVNAGVTSLYNITSASHFVSFPLLLTVGGTAKYLYMAVRGGASGTSYYVSARSSSTYANVTNSLLYFGITPKDICKSVVVNNISTVCNTTAPTGALDPSSTTSVLFKPMLYFFLTDQVLAVDGASAIDPANANYSGGVYFESQMSNRISDSTAIIVSLDTLRKGDGRLIGTFSANSTADTALFNGVIVYGYNDTTTPIATNDAIGAARAGSIMSNNISTQQSGEFTLSGLTNSRPYKISIAFQDKFLFATTLSTSLAGTPTQIQELLKKQACYILTAGFGEEHYVTNYFRSYRDRVLAKNWLGRKFIKFYYGTAPHYAAIIYKSESLRFVVRAMAYTLYFIFNYGWIVLIFLASCLFLNLRKNKIILQKNRL